MGNEKPPPIYTNLSLEHAEVRLIEVKIDGDLIVSCRLQTVPLIDSPQYYALSYVWGDPSVTTEIKVNGHSVQATTNLEAALRHLCSTGHKTLWVDAVCINQNDREERSHQVLRMSLIFRRAAGVISWLGSPTENSSRALWAIGLAGKYQWKPILADVEAIGKLLQRPYWRRVWIIQEVIYGTNVEVTCGTRKISWNEFIAGLQFIFDQDSAVSLFGDRSIREAVFQIHNLNEMRLNIIRDVPLHLLQCMRQTCHTQATDSRDKVYAVLGLAFDARNFILLPSYFHSVQTMSLEMFKTWTSARNAIDIICLQSLGPKVIDERQTWLPDWLNLHDYQIRLFIDYLTGRGRHAAQGAMHYNPLEGVGTKSSTQPKRVPLKRSRSGSRLYGHVPEGDIRTLSHALGLGAQEQQVIPSDRLFEMQEKNKVLRVKGVFVDTVESVGNWPITYAENETEKGTIDPAVQVESDENRHESLQGDGISTAGPDVTNEASCPVKQESETNSISEDGDGTTTVGIDGGVKQHLQVFGILKRLFRVQALVGDWPLTDGKPAILQAGMLSNLLKGASSIPFHREVAAWLVQHSHITPYGHTIDMWCSLFFQPSTDSRDRIPAFDSEEPVHLAILETMWLVVGEGNILIEARTNNMLGWAHPNVCRGDMIVIIKGCSVPVLLRLYREGHFYSDGTLQQWMEPRHQVVGYAFIEGVMEGELRDQIGWKYKIQDTYIV